MKAWFWAKTNISSGLRGLRIHVWRVNGFFDFMVNYSFQIYWSIQMMLHLFFPLRLHQIRSCALFAIIKGLRDQISPRGCKIRQCPQCRWKTAWYLSDVFLNIKNISWCPCFSNSYLSDRHADKVQDWYQSHYIHKAFQRGYVSYSMTLKHFRNMHLIPEAGCTCKFHLLRW